MEAILVYGLLDVNDMTGNSAVLMSLRVFCTNRSNRYCQCL